VNKISEKIYWECSVTCLLSQEKLQRVICVWFEDEAQKLLPVNCAMGREKAIVVNDGLKTVSKVK
jgi:hypothetical protein